MKQRIKVLTLAAALLLGLNIGAVQAQTAVPQPSAPAEQGHKAVKKAVKKKAAKKHKKAIKKGAKKPAAKAQHQVKAKSAKAKLH